jgi:Uma2 family endonuclease
MAVTASSTASVMQARRTPLGWVVTRPRRGHESSAIDWKQWYFEEEDDLGESPEQHDVIAVAEQLLNEIAREREWTGVLIGGNAFYQWVEAHPKVQVSPDVYVMDRPPGRLPKCFQTWKPGIHPPRLAIEIVAGDKKKDFKDAPARYAQLGCQELIIFDPAASSRSRKPPLTVFRRDEDGRFVLRSAGKGPVYSETADVWFVAVSEDGAPLLRLARDKARSAEADARAEAERARTEAERARTEAERARDEAQRRVAELEGELRRPTRRK